MKNNKWANDGHLVVFFFGIFNTAQYTYHTFHPHIVHLCVWKGKLTEKEINKNKMFGHAHHNLHRSHNQSVRLILYYIGNPFETRQM